MAKFQYRIITADGKEKTGNIEANDRDQAMTTLKNEGNYILSVGKASLLGSDINLPFAKKKIKVKDMSLFCRQFVTINRAGVTLIKTLSLLEGQTECERLKEAVAELRASVEKGYSLADSMSRMDDIFSPLFCNMVRAGEESGSIDKSFEQMAVSYEKQARINALVKKAMMYPLIVSLLAVVIVIVMLVWIVPTFMNMFAGMNIEMPAYTMFIVGLSNGLIDKWYIVLGVVLVAYLGYRMFMSTDKGKYAMATLKMRAPIFGKLTIKTACAQLSRNLGTLMSSGVTILSSLEIVSKTMSNLWYKDAIRDARLQVEKGQPLGKSISDSGLFPPMVYNMITIGEEAGALETMLETIAEYYEEEVEQTTQQVAATLEPLLIIVLAVVVIAVLLAVFMPIVTMYGGMDNL